MTERQLRRLLLTSTAILGATPAGAADWLGFTPDWFVSGNWSPAAVPTASTDVTINNGGVTNPATIGAAGAVARNVTLGSNAGNSGTLNVTGGALSGVATLMVGDFGSGTLNISNGGTVGASAVYVAVDPNGNGTVTVSGSGSRLTANALYAGMDAAATGQVTIQNGATLMSSLTVLGYFDSTANGTLTVTGATANTGSLTIGERGIGTFTLNSGSTGNSGSVTIGSNATGNGTANISDNGTTWTTGTMNIGTTGTGALTISNGASVTTNRTSAGVPVTTIGGTVTVTGSGSQWSIDGSQTGLTNAALALGTKANAAASLTVSNGGTAAIRNNATGTDGQYSDLRVGVAANSTGTLTVTGAGSSFTTPYRLLLGYNPGTTGNVVVSNGGALNTGYTSAGSNSTANITVTGAGSTWTIANTQNMPGGQAEGLSLGLGNATSTGTLTISDGGTVNVNSTGRTVNLGGNGGRGVLNIGAAAADPAAGAGTLNADAVVFVTGSVSTINFNHTSNNYVFAPGIQGAGPGTVNFLSGTTILSGNNTYVGTTTIATGATAQLGNGGATGLITGNITNDGALIFNATSNTYSGVISGNGTVEQKGVGTSTLTLTGNNTYTGLTTISGGTLRVGNGGTTGTISNNVLNNSILMFDRSNSFTHNGVIGGSGELVKAGAGVMTLGGVNTFTGGTSVQQGTLRLGGNDRLAASGSLFLFSTGTFDLGGFNQTFGDLSGPGTVAIGAGTFTAGTANNRTFAGQFTGSGAFIKQGAGSLNLTGNNAAYTGTTTVAAGTLFVNGNLSGSPVTVNSGGVLGGNGTVGTTIVNGIVAPGNSIGTLQVAGNYTQATGSTYRVEINNTPASDLIDITGTATIQSGATVNVIPAAGLYPVGYRYTILTAAGGRTGTYDNLVYNAPFLDLSLAYDPNNVYLDVTRSSVAFQQVAQTPNQMAAAGGAESLGAGSTLYNAIVGLSAEDARRAFDQLSGELYASVQNAIVESTRFVRDAILGRLRQDGAGGGAMQIATAALGDAHAGDADAALAYAGADRRGNRRTAKHPLANLAPNPVAPVLTAWAHAYGEDGRTGGDGNAASATRRTGGFITGVDVSRDGPTAWRLGLAAGYQQTGLNIADRASSATIDTYNVAVYGGMQNGPLGLRAGAAYGWNDIGAQRTIAFPGFADATRAAYSSGVAQMFGEAGYRIALHRVTFEPFAALAGVFGDNGGFVETGGAAALRGASASVNAAFSTLGIRAALPLTFAGNAASLHGSLGWRHAFAGTPVSTMTFNAGGAPFVVAGLPFASDVLAAEAGIDLRLSTQWSAGVFYAGQYAERAGDHGVRGQIARSF